MNVQGSLPWYRLRWKVLLCTAILTAVALLVIELQNSGDFLSFIADLVFCLAVIAYAMLHLFIPFRRGPGRLELAGIIVVYVAVSFGMMRGSFEIRSTCRWLSHSRDYKAQVMA